MPNVVIMGPPGVGKGTQAKVIGDALGLPHVTTGQMLRDEIANGSGIGRILAHVVDAGDFVSDALTSELLKVRLQHLDRGFVLDGFPRTPPQVAALDSMLAERERLLDLVILLEARDAVVVDRLAARSEGDRADATNDVIQHRLALYRATNPAVAELYERRGILHRIDASGSRDAVSAAVLPLVLGAIAQ